MTRAQPTDPQKAAKMAAGHAAARLVEDGMVVGLGTGSTAACFLEALAERIVNEGLKVRGVPTSRATADRARELGISLEDLGASGGVDLTVDGADEVDPAWRLIKGGGGALVREKIVARSSHKMVVVADETKLVPTLGSFPLPVAVLPFARHGVARELAQQGPEPRLRRRDGEVERTDDGLIILDWPLGEIPDPAATDARIEDLPGVVASGLFLGLATKVLVGNEEGEVRELPRSG